jgi:hypothetical protein
MPMKLLGITNVDFDVIGQRLIRSSISVRYWRKSGSIMVQLCIDFKKAFDSVRREVLYNTSGITRRCPGFKQVKYSLSVLASDCYLRYFLC